MKINISILISNFKLLRRPVIINAFLKYEGEKIITDNWGDDINYFFLSEIIKRPISIYNKVSLAMRLGLKNFLVIGSTIDMLCTTNTEVWGAGLIDDKNKLQIRPKKIYAVRGPLTRKALLQQGIDCPNVYGDPALLISLYYKPQVQKVYKYGIIPHCSNINLIKNATINGKQINEYRDILIIDLSKYQNWKDIPDQICSCENIISESLHGIIMAEAYKIPNVWIEFGNPLIGGHFKFHDFFESIGRDRKEPLIIRNNNFLLEDIIKELNLWKSGSINLQPLINSAPFKLKL